MAVTRGSRIWRWVMIAVGVAAMICAPVLYLTGWSRATGVVSLILGALIFVIGLIYPRCGQGVRITLSVVFIGILSACAAAGIWTWIYVAITPNTGA